MARLRLLCFPYAGGGASIYRDWSEGLPPTIEVLPIQLPGHESRIVESGLTSMASLVSAVGEAIKPVLDLPFALFGHSLGGLAAFELTRYLREKALAQPVCLMVSGSRAPQLPLGRDRIHRLPDSQFIQKLREYRGTPDEILNNQEFMEILLPVLRADFSILENYCYQALAPLDIPIFAYGALNDSLVDRSQLMAWEEQTSAGFKVRLFPGDHFFLHHYQPLLWQAIAQDLLETSQIG